MNQSKYKIEQIQKPQIFGMQNLLKNPKSLHMYLDATMFCLIFLASICLLTEQSTYPITTILLMFAYLIYFLIYRLSTYREMSFRRVQWKGRKPVLHSIQEDRVRAVEGSNSGGKEMFLREVGERVGDKGRDGDVSFTSYFNRSRRADQFSRSNIVTKTVTQFPFLHAPASPSSSASLLNNSYIKQMKSQEQKKQQISVQIKKLQIQYSTKYFKTLQKYKISYENAKKYTQNVRRLCLDIAKECYRENVDNLKSIYMAVQQLYEVKIVGGVGGLGISGVAGKGEGVEVQFGKVLDLLTKAKNCQLSYPKKKSQLPIPSTSQFFPIPSTTTTPTPSQCLPSLQSTRLHLNAQLTPTKCNTLPSQTLLPLLETLGTYIDDEQQQDRDYQYLPGSRVGSHQSQKLALVYSVVVSRLADILGDSAANLGLGERVVSCFGWWKEREGRFGVRRTGADFGNTYLYFVDNASKTSDKITQQQLYPQPGRNNVYSLIMLYLYTLQQKELAVVRTNGKLVDIMGRYLELVVI